MDEKEKGTKKGKTMSALTCVVGMAMMACIPRIAKITCKYGVKQCSEAFVW